MKNFISTIAMFILTFSVSAQSVSTEKVKYYLDSFVSLYLNRKTIKEEVLSKAAKLQSDYILKTGVVTHYQEDPEYRTPAFRVFKIDSNFNRGIEKEIAGGGAIPFYDKKFKCVEEQIAFNILNMIKNSPQHNYILTHSKIFGYGISIKGYEYSMVIDCI
jgi:hypothetical protein